MKEKSLNLQLVLLGLYFFLAFCVSASFFQFRSHTMSIIIFVFLLSLVKKKRQKLPLSLGLFLLLVFVNIISNTLNNNFQLSIIVYPLQYFSLIYGIYIYCDSKDKVNNILVMLLVIGLIGGPIIGLYQIITRRYLFEVTNEVYQNNIFVGTIIATANQYNPNYVSLNFFVLLVISMFLYHRTLKKIYLGISLFIIFALLLTFSRTTLIILLIFIITIFMVELREIRISKNKLAFLFIGLILMLDLNRIINSNSLLKSNSSILYLK